MWLKLLIVLLLGISSGLPLALLSSTLQAWFASEGQSIFVTSLLTMLGLPYMLRVLWAPLLDQYCWTKFGRRRSWMLATQLILVIGFIGMSWMSPSTTALYLVILAGILAIVSASQDMAIEAQRIEFLSSSELGIGAAMATLGYRIGLILSGGVALILAQHMGWRLTYQIMAGLMVIGILTTLLIREAPGETKSATSITTLYWHPLQELLHRPGILLLFGFIFFYKIGEVFTTITSGIVMPFLLQGLHFSLDTVGMVYQMVGVGSLIVGGLISGILLMRLPLTRGLLQFGLIQAFANLLFLGLAIVGKNLYLLIFAVICDNFAAGMGSTALVALMMRCVDQRHTATQFAILVMFSTIPRILSGPLSAALQHALGWVGLYQCAFILSLMFVPFLWYWKKTVNSQSVDLAGSF